MEVWASTAKKKPMNSRHDKQGARTHRLLDPGVGAKSVVGVLLNHVRVDNGHWLVSLRDHTDPPEGIDDLLEHASEKSALMRSARVRLAFGKDAWRPRAQLRSAPSSWARAMSA